MAREFTYHRGRVLARYDLSPHLVRVVLGGEEIALWASSGSPDEALLIVVPGDGELTMPEEITDGDPYARSRWYTVRGFDPDRRELTVDVVLHDKGVATRWARTAEVGDPVGISSTHQWYALPTSARWQVLCGDIVALPAIGRILEQTPQDVPTRAFVEIPDPADAQPELGPSVTWVHNPDLHSCGSGLAEVVRGIELPSGPGYLYVAGEAAATRAVRKYLRHEVGLRKDAYSVVGYWRVRSEEWMQRYVEANIDLEPLYRDGQAAGMDAEELSDEVDRQLEAAGL